MEMNAHHHSQSDELRLPLKYLKGSVCVMSKGYKTALPALSQFVLTTPLETLNHWGNL